MINDLPWPVIGPATGGWVLFGLMMFGLVTGRWLVTRREADLPVKALEKAEERISTLETLNQKLTQQNGELGEQNGELLRQNGIVMESSEISNTVMRALRDDILKPRKSGP